MQKTTFAPDFLWGAATSAYQIEGAARDGGRGPSIWDYFAATPGKTFRGQTGAVAIDHYHRMEEDVALMAALGIRAYRFSLAWPRILPDGTGTVNVRGLDFYERLVDTLLHHQITPFVTLYHWDLPLALHRNGGWLARDTAAAFAEYAVIVARRLGDRVTWWVTQNEPWCAAYYGYGVGLHAPGDSDLTAAVIAGHHLLLSHGLALQALRAELRNDARLGIALNLQPVDAADDAPATLRACADADMLKNRWMLDPLLRGAYPAALFDWWHVQSPPVQRGDMALISQPLDFIGINYYSRALVQATATGYAEIAMIPEAEYTGMRWEVYPNGLTHLLRRVHDEYATPPLIVTENGAAFPDAWDGRAPVVDDPERCRYLQQHIAALEAAIQAGVRLQGYFAWSLFDNFEWTEGYRQRFGLIYVDFATQRRVIKSSGRWYGDFIQGRL